MNEPQLTRELADLERRLMGIRADDRPPPVLRARVLDGVHTSLRRDRRRRARNWAAGMAVSALVWLNLSLCAVQNTDLGLDNAVGLESRAELAARIRELLPEASDREVARQTILLECGSRLGQYPRPTVDLASLRALDRYDL